MENKDWLESARPSINPKFDELMEKEHGLPNILASKANEARVNVPQRHVLTPRAKPLKSYSPYWMIFGSFL